MKRILKSVSILIILALVSVNCEKATDNPPVVNPPAEKDNEMVYNDTSYALSQGFFEYYGQFQQGGAYNLDLYLLSSGFVLHEVDGVIDSISGGGESIYFELFSADSAGLAEGTYSYDSNYPGESGTFTSAGGVIGFDFENETGFEFEIEDGTFTVTKDGDYEFNFSGTDELNHSVTLYFKGEIPFIEFE